MIIMTYKIKNRLKKQDIIALFSVMGISFVIMLILIPLVINYPLLSILELILCTIIVVSINKVIWNCLGKETIVISDCSIVIYRNCVSFVRKIEINLQDIISVRMSKTDKGWNNDNLFNSVALLKHIYYTVFHDNCYIEIETINKKYRICSDPKQKKNILAEIKNNINKLLL